MVFEADGGELVIGGRGADGGRVVDNRRESTVGDRRVRDGRVNVKGWRSFWKY